MLAICAVLLTLGCSAETVENSGVQGAQTASQVPDNDWIDILNPDLEEWKATGKPEAFFFADGSLECDGTGGEFFYYSLETFQDFEIQAQVRVSEGANSGIFLRVSDPEDEVQTGFEIQVLDSYGKSVPGTHDFGAVYDIQAPSVNAARPAGEWNDILVICIGPQVRVEINGKTIVDVNFDEWTQPGKNPDGTDNKFRMAYKDLIHPGYLGFQDHGARVWYRNVMVRKVD